MTVEQADHLLRSGRIYESRQIALTLARGGNSKAARILAIGYLACREYVKAAFWAGYTNDSELLRKCESHIGAG